MEDMIFYDILSSPIVWENREKFLLRSIETERRIKISDHFLSSVSLGMT